MHKFFKKHIILLTLLVVIIAYQGLAIYQASKPIPIEQALADYDYMWEMLEENYPLFAVAERKTGKSKEQIKVDYRKRLVSQESETITLENFHNHLSQCLSEFQGVGHLKIINAQNYRSIVKGAELMSETNTNADMRTFYDYVYGDLHLPHTQSTYKLLAQNALGVSVNESTKNLTFKDYGQDTAYVSIRSFMGDYIEKDAPVLLKWFEDNAHKKNIIIDVTSNGGGNDYYWAKNIIAPNISEPKYRSNYFLMKDGRDTKGLYIGVKDRLISDWSEVRSLPKLEAADLEGIAYIGQTNFTVKPSRTEPILTGNVYVLIGGRSFSSTEGFAGFCKQSGFATLVGSRTGGDGASGVTPIAKALPNTGILVFYRCCNNLNPDGSSNMQYGTAPDIPVYGGKSPLETCLDKLGLADVIPTNVRSR